MSEPSAVVKSLGRKARKRLEEEKSKRSEIVRLNETVIQPTTERRTNAFDDAIIKPSNYTKKRKRVNVKKSAVIDKNVDRWTPDLSHLYTVSDKESLSKYVQVHGIPVKTLPGQLQTFFQGLDPRRIVLLPPQPDESDGQSTLTSFFLDANDQQPRKVGVRVRRYPSKKLRAWVEFDSSKTATLATLRSGEILTVSSEEGPVGASIAVTQLPKALVAPKWLAQRVFVVAQPRVYLHESLERIKVRLNPLVLDVVWEVLYRHLEEVKQFVSSDRKKLKPRSTSSRHWGLSQLEAKEKAIQEKLQALAFQLPFPCAQAELDPTLLHIATGDPIARLTTGARLFIQEDLQEFKDRSQRLRLLERVSTARELPTSA